MMDLLGHLNLACKTIILMKSMSLLASQETADNAGTYKIHVVLVYKACKREEVKDTRYMCEMHFRKASDYKYKCMHNTCSIRHMNIIFMFHFN